MKMKISFNKFKKGPITAGNSLKDHRLRKTISPSVQCQNVFPSRHFYWHLSQDVWYRAELCGAECSSVDQRGVSLLHAACYRGDLQRVRSSIKIRLINCLRRIMGKLKYPTLG